MKKIIIVAGAPDTGKTTTTNALIKKLLSDGYRVESLEDGKRFWEKPCKKTGEYNYSGNVVLNKNGGKILVVTYGDTMSGLELVLTEDNLAKVDTVVCCSHATRGKEVFGYMNGRAIEWFKSGVKIIPLFKNLLSHFEVKEQENEYFAELIKGLL